MWMFLSFLQPEASNSLTQPNSDLWLKKSLDYSHEAIKQEGGWEL